MEKENYKIRFTLIWSSCLCVLLLMVGLGVSSSVKGTSAAETCTCPSGGTLIANNNCQQYSSSVIDGWTCTIQTSGQYAGKYSCIKAAYCEDGSTLVCSAGTYYNSISKTCVVCPANYRCPGITVNTGTTSRDAGKYACDFGYTSSTGSSTCSCSGYVDVNGECVSDTAGDDDSENDDSSSTTYACYLSGGLYHWVSPDSVIGQNGQKVTASSKEACDEMNDTPGYACYLSGGLYHWVSPDSVIGQNGQKVTASSKEACDEMNEEEEYETLTATFDASNTGGGTTTETCQIPKGTSGTNECSVTAPSGSWGIIHSDGSTSEVYCVNPVGGGEIIKITTNITYRSCKSGSGGNPTPTPDDDPTPTPDDDPTPTPDDDDEEPSSSVEKEEPSSDTNVEENPQTSEIAIFVVWVVAAMAIVYSIWYFKQVREN